MHIMTHSSPITFCISTYNNLPYLKLAIQSVRKNSYFKDAPFIIHAENCTDGTNEWLLEKHLKYNLQIYIQTNETPLGIGGGMNFCADKVTTEYINFLHSDFYVTNDWDKALLDVHEKYPTEDLWVNSHRVEPNMFNNPSSRPGTVIVPPDMFGAYHDNFNQQMFEEWATEFKDINVGIEISKGEGVSGLVKKSVWDMVGGNDPIFAPTSWDDMDLFLRMIQANIRFVLPVSSVVWHFGARGSHRLEENAGKTSERQQIAEIANTRKWIEKWGGLPIFDHNEMICGINLKK
jgi:GT2 family glycosyltransferase